MAFVLRELFFAVFTPPFLSVVVVVFSVVFLLVDETLCAEDVFFPFRTSDVVVAFLVEECLWDSLRLVVVFLFSRFLVVEDWIVDENLTAELDLETGFGVEDVL